MIHNVRVGCLELYCNNKHFARGYCSWHYRTYRLDLQKRGQWDNKKRLFRTQCEVVGCEGKHVAKGMCQKHYSEKIRTDNQKFIVDRFFPNGIICPNCNKTMQFCQIDSHHKDPNIKEQKIGEMINNISLSRNTLLIDELDKCVFMCARCHQNLHCDPHLTYEESNLDKRKGRKIDKAKRLIREKFGTNCKQCNDYLPCILEIPLLQF